MMQTNARLTVFYDGACPLCRREITWYQRLQGAENIHWKDVSQQSQGEVAPGLCATVAMQRFHVETQDGRIESGALAFAEVWKQLRYFKPLGHVVTLPLVRNVAELAYRVFLKFRPRLQRLLISKKAADLGEH